MPGSRARGWGRGQGEVRAATELGALARHDLPAAVRQLRHHFRFLGTMHFADTCTPCTRRAVCPTGWGAHAHRSIIGVCDQFYARYTSIHVFSRTAIRGAVWYQGEADASHPGGRLDDGYNCTSPRIAMAVLWPCYGRAVPVTVLTMALTVAWLCGGCACAVAMSNIMLF